MEDGRTGGRKHLNTHQEDGRAGERKLPNTQQENQKRGFQMFHKVKCFTKLQKKCFEASFFWLSRRGAGDLGEEKYNDCVDSLAQSILRRSL